MLIRWQKTIATKQGPVVPGAVLTIRRESDQALVTVYRDRDGTDPYPTGTVTADENGYAFFYALPDLYRITSLRPAIDWRDEGLSTAIIDFAGQPYVTVADMEADMSQPVGTLGRVSTGEGAGDYVMTATGWEWSDVQPINREDIEELEALIDGCRQQAIEQCSAVSQNTPEAAWFGEFYNDDSEDQPSLGIIDELGNWGWVLGNDGAPDGGSVPAYEFYNDDEITDEKIIVSSDGLQLFGWNELGEQTYPEVSPPGPAPESEVPLMPYVESGILHAVGSDDYEVADLSDVEILSTASGTAKTVRAVIRGDRTGGKAESISAGPALPLRAIPDALNRVFGVAGVGQSLCIGARSSSTMQSTVPLLPEQVLMPDVGANSDVRLGIDSVSASTVTALDPADFVGFIPMVAKVGVGSGSTQGETPLEATCTNIALRAREIGLKSIVMGFNAGAGGTGYAGLKKGTLSYENLLAAAEKSAELFAGQGMRYVLNCLLLKHGESNQGTSSYYDHLIEWQGDFDSDIKSRLGQSEDVHFLMHQPSSHTVYNAIAGSGAYGTLAMVEAHLNSPFHHLAGPDYPHSAFFYTDYLHFTGPGYFLIGEDNEDHYEEVFWMGKKSQVLLIDSVTRVDGTTFDVNYKVPVAPLVFDTALVPERDVKGYTIDDENGPVQISSADIVDDGTANGTARVRIITAAPPMAGVVVLSYAMSPNSGGRDQAGIPRGNVRDSKGRISRFDGRLRHNWAHHQRVVVQS